MSKCNECYYLEKESLKIDIENKKLLQENTELKEKLDKAIKVLKEAIRYDCSCFGTHDTHEDLVWYYHIALKALGYFDNEEK